MFVADFPVTAIPLQQPFLRRGRNDRHMYRMSALPVVHRHFPLFVVDLFIAEFDVEAADNGIFADTPFRDVELQLLRLFRKASHPGFIPLLSLGNVRFRHIIFSLRSVGHLRSRIVIIDVVFQLLDMISLLFKGLEDRHGRIPGRGEHRTGIVLQQFQRFLHEELLVLADHALTVLAAGATPCTFVPEQHLIGRIVLAGKALRLIEVVAFQLGHVALVEPSGDVLDPRRLPRVVTPLGEMIVVDLLLDLRGVFGDLGGDAYRNILLVEHLGQSVDQLAQFQPRADVGFRLAELAHQRLDGMASRLDGLVIGRGLLAGFHVLALQVLRDGSILGLGVRKIPDKGRNVCQTRHRGRPVAALAVDDLEALVLGAHADRLKHARLPDALGKLQKRLLPKVLAGVVGRIDDLVQVQKLNLRFLLLHGYRLGNRSLYLGTRILRRGSFGGYLLLRFWCSCDRNDCRRSCTFAALLRFRIRFHSLHNIEQFLPCVSRVCARTISI